jgi:hypothetical protein
MIKSRDTRLVDIHANVDLWVAAPTEKAACVQEAHLVIGHMVCELVESRGFTDGHGLADPP